MRVIGDVASDISLEANIDLGYLILRRFERIGRNKSQAESTIGYLFI